MEATIPISLKVKVAIRISSTWVVKPIPKVVIHCSFIYVYDTKMVIPIAISLVLDVTILTFKVTVAMLNSSIQCNLICHDDTY